MRQFLKISSFGMVATACVGAGAVAHHGFGGRYDASAPIYLEGVVTDAYFGFPHAEVTMRAEQEPIPVDLPATTAPFVDGLRGWSAELGEELEIEFPPVRRFFDLEGRIGEGDRIAVIAFRNCEPPHELRGQWVAPAAGEPVVRSGRMQSQVDGC